MNEHLEEFGSVGLRTLALAMKIIEREKFVAWEIKYKEAMASPSERDSKMEALQSEIETELELVCATAIEDKL